MGILIALDGLDGSGKETQTRLLEQALKAQGFVGVHKKDSEWARWLPYK